ncbi:AAA family ATPase [Sphaerisporangium sp. B11E5]|uniref:helix-turn-helix transcriptional regulator n=1 Tax=Sphaerisporangium sp. B11E5 TaxID=3153563 RepID=UPI00325F9A5C
MDTPLVERAEHLGVFEERLQGLSCRSGGFVVISGVAGSGKTRLLSEVRRLAGRLGVRVLTARSSHLEQRYPFGVVRQLFRLVLARATPEERASWLSGDAAPAVASIERHTGGDVRHGDYRTLHGLFWLMSNLCESGPLLLQVDDLHWADEPSLRFLAYLLPRLEGLPVLVAAGARPPAPQGASRLLDVLMADQVCETVHLAPLSHQGVASLVRGLFGQAPDDDFTGACVAVTGGNPLLVVESSRALAARRLPPTAPNAPRLRDAGSQAVARRVMLELSLLRPAHTRIAEAIAVLGPRTTVSLISAFTGLPVAEVADGVSELEPVNIIQETSATWRDRSFDFVHPLVAAAVYDHMDHSQRLAAHERAARLLLDAGAGAEEIAAHVLRQTRMDQGEVVGILRRAGREALDRGAPEAALSYHRHALTTALPADERPAVLAEAVEAALQVDQEQAATFLLSALELTPGVRERAELAARAGFALLYEGREHGNVSVIQDLLDELPPGEDEPRRMLEAIILSAANVTADTPVDPERLKTLRELPPSDTAGATHLDCALALRSMYLGDPAARELAHRALASPFARSRDARGTLVLMPAYFTLVYGEADQGIPTLNRAVHDAQANGSLAMLGVHHLQRGTGWLHRGELAEAAGDLRESVRLITLTGSTILLPSAVCLLAETLLEMGEPEQARRVVEGYRPPVPRPRVELFFFAAHAEARLLRADGRFDAAYERALAAGEGFAAHQGRNPAVLAWRSEAALSAHALDRAAEARVLADEEVELARRWGAAFPLGRALRVAAAVAPPDHRIERLQQAREVLTDSTARLELAKVLIDLGGALRRVNSRKQAAELLTEGRELAHRCGARRLVADATARMRAAGQRPRPLSLVGPDTLTPSELRVAGLARDGLSNREIAQALFVTPKTVETHLSSAYRKLAIERRDDLRTALPPGEPGPSPTG